MRVLTIQSCVHSSPEGQIVRHDNLCRVLTGLQYVPASHHEDACAHEYPPFLSSLGEFLPNECWQIVRHKADV